MTIFSPNILSPFTFVYLPLPTWHIYVLLHLLPRLLPTRTTLVSYDDGSFDAVVDKGTLDALMSEDTVEVRNSGTAMLREVARVLKPGGR